MIACWLYRGDKWYHSIEPITAACERGAVWLMFLGFSATIVLHRGGGYGYAPQPFLCRPGRHCSIILCSLAACYVTSLLARCVDEHITVITLHYF